MGTRNTAKLAAIQVDIYDQEIAAMIMSMNRNITSHEDFIGELQFPKDSEERANFCYRSKLYLNNALKDLESCLKESKQHYADIYQEVLASKSDEVMALYSVVIKKHDFITKTQTLKGLISALRSRITEVRAERGVLKKAGFYTSDSSLSSTEFRDSPIEPEFPVKNPKPVQQSADVLRAAKSVDIMNQPEAQASAAQNWQQQGMQPLISQTAPNTPFQHEPLLQPRPITAFRPIPDRNAAQYQFQPLATSSALPNHAVYQLPQPQNGNPFLQDLWTQQQLPSPVMPPPGFCAPPLAQSVPPPSPCATPNPIWAPAPPPAPVNHFPAYPVHFPQYYPNYNNMPVVIQRETIKKTKIPRFDGTGDFGEFWAVFEAIVHQNPDYNEVEKVVALKESIVGEAAIAIKGIQAIPRNYLWMIGSLHERFANLPVNRSAIVSEVEELPFSGESPQNWTKTLDRVKSSLNRMVSTGENILARNEHMWEKKICEKFPNRIIVPILVKLNKDPAHTLGDFMRELTSQVLAQAAARQQVTHHRENKDVQPAEKPKPLPAERKQQTVFVNKFACFLCGNKGHFSKSCPNITDPKEILDLLRSKNACEKCYSTFHATRDCQKPNCQCGGLHFSKLCSLFSQSRPQNKPFTNQFQRKNVEFPRPQANSQATMGPQNAGQHSVVDLTNISESRTVLMTVEGEVYNEVTQNFQMVLFFIDPGAQISLIQEDLAKQFGLTSGKPEKRTLYGIGGISETFESFKVQVKIRTGPESVMHIKMTTKPVITTALQSADLNSLDSNYLHQFGIHLNNAQCSETTVPGILIGIDYFRYFVELKDVIDLPSGLQVTKTVLGPTVFGAKSNVKLLSGTSPESDKTVINSFVGVATFQVDEKTTDQMVSEMFELEGLGIRRPEGTDTRAEQYFQKYREQLKFENGVITAPFPLKPTVETINDNFPIAFRRLQALGKQLQASPKVKEWYVKIMQQYLTDGIIEEVSDSQHDWGPKYYMPHHGVWKEEKQTPLRIVFDASSKQKNENSLNDVIEKGECFVNKIHDILVTSRFSPIILVCDIQSAFTQVRINEEHRDLCRFLWVKNPDEHFTRKNTVIYRFKRLPFGINASPSILNISLTEFLTQENSKLSGEILDSLYVDNILLSALTPKEAIEKYESSKNLFKKVSMNLREYTSNNIEVNSAIPEKDLGKQGEVKLLGVHFNTISDTFCVSIKFPDNQASTKRQCLSQLHSIYDPIGLTAPALIKLKQLMREIFEARIDWNSPLPPELKEQWIQETQRVEGITLQIPRLVQSSKENTGILWGFADASKSAMAVCTYFQPSETENSSSLLSGKTKLSPRKRKMTIPQLELSAIEMLLLLCKSMQNSLNGITEKINILSDSCIALTWIKTSKKVPRHVSHQVHRVRKLIRDLEEEFCSVFFFHIPTNFNIADIGTRGEFGTSLADSSWLSGPSWLRKPKEGWPIRSIDTIPENKEAFAEYEPIVNPPVVLTTTILESVSGCINLIRFGKEQTAVRTVARIGKGLKNWVNKVNENRRQSISLTKLQLFDSDEAITATDFKLGENILILQEQSAIEMNELQRRFPSCRFNKDENGIIRAASRLENASLPRDTREPIVLPPGSYLVDLLVHKAHKETAHGGVEHVKTALRQKFFIPRIGRRVQKILSKCSICKRYQGLPFGTPEMPQLPKDRVTVGKPFQYTGVDYLGPLKGKNDQEFYVCLFTCLTTRAVHLEVVDNLTAGGFLQCLIKFVSRRGVPTVIRSDNGRQFTLAHRMLSTARESHHEHDSTLMSYCSNNGIKWLFNVAKAPWTGGAWERLVGSVKKAFYKSFGRRKLTTEEISTSIVQIEAILNTRPLTHVDSCDLSRLPLRPIDFLQGAVKYGLPNITDTDTNDPDYDVNLLQSVAQARQAIQFSETVAQKFWEQWKTEYLTAIRNIHKFDRKQPRHQHCRIPEVGEIVIIHQDLIPRGHWNYGRIEELLTSSDGLVRAVKVRLPNGQLIDRSLSLIVPLEIRSDSSIEITQHLAAPRPTDSAGAERRIQPARAAKTRAQQARQGSEREINNENPIEDSVSVIHSGIEEMSRTNIRPRAGQNINTGGMVALLLACSLCQVTTGIQMNCTEHEVQIGPMTTNWSICIAGKCAEHLPSSFPATFPLPVHPTRTEVLVTASDGNETTEIICFPTKFCDKATPFLSKSLLGNPHCNPENALLSAAIICALVLGITTIIPATIWSAVKLYKNRTEPKTPQTVEQTVEQTQTEEIQLDIFDDVAERIRNFRPVSPKQLVTIVTLFSLVSNSLMCQMGHTRTNVDMICDQEDHCYLEFTKELLFNPLIKELCLELITNNITIGKLQVTHMSDKLQCDKFSKFYIRETETEVFTAYRCPLFGSCIPQTCVDLPKQYAPPELAEAKEYPGYFYCRNQNWFWCPTSESGCYFFKVAQVPKNNQTYEVFQCNGWLVTSLFEISFTTQYSTETSQIDLRPYETMIANHLNMTIISSAHPHEDYLDRTFVSSETETLILPRTFVHGATCSSIEDAEQFFQYCTPGPECSCSMDSGEPKCNCPYHSLATLRTNSDNVLPLRAGHTTLSKKGPVLVADGVTGETTLAVTLNNITSTATDIILQHCDVKVGELNGCYSCQTGATVEIECKTKLKMFAAVTCDSQSFQVTCSSKQPKNNVTLHYENAVVKDKCTVNCGINNTEIQIQGTLHYHPHIDPIPDNPNGTHPYSPFDWFNGWSFPDLEPLWHLIVNHWKISIVLAIMILILIGMTISLGPSIILSIFQLLFGIIGVCLKFVFDTLVLTIECGSRLLRASSQAPPTRD